MQGYVRHLYPLVKLRLQPREKNDEMASYGGTGAELAGRLCAGRKAREKQEGGARLLREGTQPEGFRGCLKAFRRDLQAAQPERRGRAARLQGVRGIPQGQVPAVEERGEARLRRWRLRHLACACRA